MEGVVEGVVGDVFGVDFDAFEEGLAEESAFGGVGVGVGGFDVVGELEGVVERVEDEVVFDAVALEELFGGVSFAADAFLFFAEDVV